MDLNTAVQKLSRLQPGETFVYHEGFLAPDKEYIPGLETVARLMLNASREGRVHLTQRRVGPGKFHYRATGARR